MAGTLTPAGSHVVRLQPGSPGNACVASQSVAPVVTVTHCDFGFSSVNV